MKERFVFAYHGSGRPSGMVCQHDHAANPAVYGGVATYQCVDGFHNETDGYPSRQSDEEIDRDFQAGAHDEGYHVAEPGRGCPVCERR